MAKTKNDAETARRITAKPHFHPHAQEIQAYGTVNHALPLELEEPVRLEMIEQLNQMLADTITLRDLYKKSHWQVAGPTFNHLHLLYDKHYGDQVELVDSIAERIQLLGGVSLAMAADAATLFGRTGCNVFATCESHSGNLYPPRELASCHPQLRRRNSGA